MKYRAMLVILAMMVSSNAGCWSLVFAKQRQQAARQKLLDRAAFDFGCPAERLILTSIQSTGDDLSGNDTTAYGVTGCGKRATYIIGPYYNWVLESQISTENPSPAAPSR